MSKIIHWTIKITWSDGEEEYLSDIPDAIAKPTDDYLDALESRRNKAIKEYISLNEKAKEKESE